MTMGARSRKSFGLFRWRKESREKEGAQDSPETLGSVALATSPEGSEQHSQLSCSEAGLHVIFDSASDSQPPSVAEIDVVAVHGLNFKGSVNHAQETWMKGDKLWLKDFLPASLPRPARVMLFAYNSSPAIEASAIKLDDHAKKLLHWLHLEREDEQRPIVFICHSLGGLVVKQALVEAKLDESYKSIFEATCLLAFFATPHQGGNYASVGHVAAKIARTVLIAPSNDLLSALKKSSDEATRRFEQARHLSEKCLVISFFEGKPHGKTGIIVDKRSATLNLSGLREKQVSMEADHSSICKFDSKDSAACRLVLKTIAAEVKRSLELAQKTLKSSARPVKHQYAVPLETVHTYTERAKLSAEIEQKIKIRHEKGSVPYAVALHGLGGAGKSQLALAYAEKHKDRYNPILWIDATDEEAVRSSFRRCAAELGLPEERAEKQESVLTDGVVQAVLRWLRDRTEADDEWLVIVDNADNVSWGIKKIMPKGNRGSIIVTSQDNQSVRLIPGACEAVQISVMSPVEGVALLLQHLQLSAESASEAIRCDCDKIAQRLGYLALAIDLAGAHISNDSAPKRALSQYLADYDRHRDELLQMDGFKGLLPTQKTVWTVWDTTLEKIRREYSGLQPELLLTFLARFKGSIVQDELFRLACFGMAEVDAALDGKTDEVIPAGLRQFLPLDKGEWDSFRYRQSRDVLVRYSLLQQVEGQWPGVSMHSLVQWRAMQNELDRPWRWWYMTFILAACFQIIGGKEQPEFRRHLMVHLLSISENDIEDGDRARYEDFVGSTFGLLYYEEGRWEEAEKLFMQVMESCKTKLGTDHPDTLRGMANLASTYRKQGRWEEAEKLKVQVMETRKIKLGADHPDTLASIGSLASIYRKQGRWEEAEKLEVQVMETSKIKLGADHPDTLASIGSLASIYRKQGRWEEAEKLEVQVMETSKIKLGADHPDTLTSMNNLAFTWKSQGRHSDALALMEECVQARQRLLGAEHPNTLSSLAAVANWS
ncbi:putative kinesin light chain, partial [Cladorrhinum sp. PSN259]